MSLPEVIKSDNPIMVAYKTNLVNEWICMKLCPKCKHKLTTDGKSFWCYRCGWSEKSTEDRKVNGGRALSKGWTKKEDEWLAKNWAVRSPEELCQKLGRSYNAIRGRTVTLRKRGIDVPMRERYRGGRKKK